MITKDLYAYTIIFLHQDKTLRYHSPKHGLVALLVAVYYIFERTPALGPGGQDAREGTDERSG
jgi:hypothetical protein